MVDVQSWAAVRHASSTSVVHIAPRRAASASTR